MTVTTLSLVRASAVAAVAAGLLFVGVQIGHPPSELASVPTTEWAVRNALKVLMAVLTLVGITGMYLRQVERAGVLGLVGWALLGVGYLAIACIAFVAAVVLPSLVETSPDYVADVVAAGTGGEATGDIGLFTVANLVSGVGYLLGGLVLGVALFRARVLARWASALLAVGTVTTAAGPLLPLWADRLLAFPTGIALVGLGVSLWRSPGDVVRGSAPVDVGSVRTRG